MVSSGVLDGSKDGIGVIFVSGFYFILSDQCVLGHVSITKAWQLEIIPAKENDSLCVLSQ